MSRRPPPQLLDHLSQADREADAWLAARGVRWRWPRVQGAQPSGKGEVDDVVRVAASRGQVVRDPTAEAIEAREALTALWAAGRIDASWRRLQAEPATCGDAADDAPALPVASAAGLAGCSLRTVQIAMRRLNDVERAGGQLVLPCVPTAAEVYKARPRDGGAP